MRKTDNIEHLNYYYFYFFCHKIDIFQKSRLTLHKRDGHHEGLRCGVVHEHPCWAHLRRNVIDNPTIIICFILNAIIIINKKILTHLLVIAIKKSIVTGVKIPKTVRVSSVYSSASFPLTYAQSYTLNYSIISLHWPNCCIRMCRLPLDTD